jgi:hypothetical protein
LAADTFLLQVFLNIGIIVTILNNMAGAVFNAGVTTDTFGAIDAEMKHIIHVSHSPE